MAVYGIETVVRTTVNRCAIKSRNNEVSKLDISNESRSGRLDSLTDDEHR